MFTQPEIQKMVFFDLETASTYSSLDELRLANSKMAELWEKRCDYLRTRFEENKEMSNEELYVAKAGLTPEFSRIVCASFGRISFQGDDITGVEPAPFLLEFKKFLLHLLAINLLDIISNALIFQ